jgi:diacylglycerol kinase family enzyme
VAAAQGYVRALSRDGRTVRGEVGADDPVLAVEDALRTFGADEVLVAGGDGIVDAVRARVAVPVRAI